MLNSTANKRTVLKSVNLVDEKQTLIASFKKTLITSFPLDFYTFIEDTFEMVEQ